MNVLRLPRVWASPIAHLYHGTARSITTSSLLAPETAPNAFRRTDKSISRFQISFLRALSTDGSPADAAPEVTAPAENQKLSASPQNPKAAHLPYQIEKSKSGNLPVYEVHAAGRIKSTVIRKVKGDLQELAGDIKKALKLSNSQVRVNETTGRVEVAGARENEVKAFLRAQGLAEDFTPLSSSRKTSRSI
ncbi:hypothetical protein TWF281_006933 [Arthrobotrys megalospora]